MIKMPFAPSRSFASDEKGSVAIMFGLTVVAVTMFIGMSFDYGRAIASKAKVAVAVDAAALAAAKGIRLEGLTDEAAIALAKSVFNENMRGTSGNWTDIEDVKVTIDRATSKATVEAAASVKTTFTAISGIDKLGAPGAATAVFEARDIEVAVQLDLTGSMCSPCTKLDDLKDATKDLVKTLIPSTPTVQKVRVGFAPFSAGVNVGAYLADVNGNRASASACVYERQSTTNELTDAAPVGLDAYKIKSDFAGPVQNCPTSEIVPLTNDREALITAADGFEARSSTAGQLGAAWAWNLISPKWKDIWPTASRPVEYADTKTDKIVILMTDGVYNTIGGRNFGDLSAEAVQASKMSVDLCTAMKDQGIAIYTVGFDLNSIPNMGARNRATKTLQDCAGRKGVTGHEGFFYNADDGDQLRAAFNNIATAIMRLRLAS